MGWALVGAPSWDVPSATIELLAEGKAAVQVVVHVQLNWENTIISGQFCN